ncbi:hypothetical protein DSC91_001684 [Paraburkholderia caffeinilytica]|uniref:Cysteine rich repeat-containing protein n=1 Tax=Paraburkholderia caffeinilytica TaxID=1761016 RepID=A0ABQ1N9E1_9BURK|nr:hypothetical protein [Paraburkholderia caffeinilytica]AXL49753.1 hypothetical protein DSC91_001684 [Paraburkholderia caffeinilytica]GGC60964.1 hypothetical protein GCM10011400_55870 [Paraburkholderia caffeinilytica]CAB3795206.1 hypothetical protein LMG28690_04063 [Paraburkholderia caffeinilytica]
MKRTYAVLAASLAALGVVIAANAASGDDRAKVCRSDAIHFCAAHIPSKAKITACMKEHLDELSPACRAMFEDDKKDDANAASQ